MLEIQLEGMQKLEAHAHSSPVSGCSNLEAGRLSSIYKSLGFSTLILTNHYNAGYGNMNREATVYRYLDAYGKEREIGRELGINVLMGVEVSIPVAEFNENGEYAYNWHDFLLYGITRELMYKYYPLTSFSQFTLYEMCKAHNILMLQAHPYRNGKHPCDLNCMDGIEVFNAHYYSEKHTLDSYRVAAERNMIMTAGTDCHDAESAADAFMLVPKEIETVEDYRDYLREARRPIMANRTLGIIDPSSPPANAEHVR